MKLLLGWICSVWESTKKSSSAMTSEALSFYIWKGEILRYFLCATFLLLTIFFDKTTTNFSSFPALVIACSLAYTVQICNKLICAVLGPDFLKCWLELTTKNICDMQNFLLFFPPALFRIIVLQFMSEGIGEAHLISYWHLCNIMFSSRVYCFH